MNGQKNAPSVVRQRDGATAGTLLEKNDPTTKSQINDATKVAPRKPLFDVDGLIAAGLQLIPLHKWDAEDDRRRPRGKTPRDGAWQAKGYDSVAVLAEATKTGRNIGVRLPASVVVLDVDPRNFPEGRDCLAEVVEAFKLDLSLAPHVITGSGGHHYYFQKPADVAVVDSLKDFPGIEFKSLGRQVVAPGSLHPCGERYEWDDYSPAPTAMPELPAAVLETIKRAGRASSEREAGELSPSQLEGALEWLAPEDFSNHEDWLNLAMACHHATNGEGRQEFINWSTQDPDYQDHAWIIGNRWDSFHNAAPQGGMPVTARLLHKLVQEAGGHVPNPDPEDEFEAWEESIEPPKPSRWRFLSIDELEALPPPRWLIPGMLTEGSLAAIYGAPESGKSFLAVDMAMAIASGLDWHGREVMPGGALYIAAEGAPGLGKRVRAWKLEHSAQEKHFGFALMRDDINFAPEKDTEVQAFTKAVVSELGQSLRLIIIDTLNQTAAGADENSAKDMGRYIASMKKLRDTTGATVVVIHHSGKDINKGMRGSTALLGAMDTTIEVERDKDGHSIKVSVQKQKDSDKEIPMRFRFEKVADSLVLRPTLMATTAADDFAPNPIVELANELTAEQGGTLPLKSLVEQVCERESVSDKTARRKIEKAIPSGRLDAVAAMNGASVWLEPIDARNPKLGIVVRSEGEA